MRAPNAGDTFGRYQLDRVLGQGGMGIVFAATDPRLHRTVAVKVITGALAASPEFRARFQAEAESLARLDSPHVIAIFDHDEVDQTPYIVTQYVDGTDLATLLAEGGALPAQHALRLCAQVARGLSDAHQVGVIHRDVKPGNVLLRGVGTTDLHAFLCDFGIARADGDGALAPATAAGTIAGTWSYLAPERIAGAPATALSDVYALGCVLWSCLTGVPPYRGAEFQVALDHQQAPVPQLPGASEFVADLNRVLARALAKDPGQRFASAAAFRVELERLAALAPEDTLDGAPRGTSVRQPLPGGVVPPPPGAALAAPLAPPPPPSPVTAPPARGRRRGAAALVAVAAALALIAGGAVAWWAPWEDDTNDAADAATPDGPPVAAEQVAGDLDGDGLGDLAIWQWRFDAPLSPLPLRTLSSSGTTFGTPQEFGGAEGTAIRGDVSGDGLDDIVWIEQTEDEELAVHVQPSGGDAWDTTVAIDEGADISDYLTRISDVTGDGTGDLVLIGDGIGVDVLHVAAGTGDGFEAAVPWWTSEVAGGSIWPGEFTGDDTDDILYGTVDAAGDSNVTILVSDGSRLTAGPRRFMNSPKISPYLATWLTGDITGDGRDELVIRSADNHFLFTFLVADDAIVERAAWWKSDMTVTERRVQLRSSDVVSMTLSDVDGDGDDDVAQEIEVDGSETFNFITYLSTGEAFEDPTVWGAFDCTPECDDFFQLVG